MSEQGKDAERLAPGNDREASRVDAEAVVGELRRIYADLLTNSKPLDPESRRILDEHKWDLCI